MTALVSASDFSLTPLPFLTKTMAWVIAALVPRTLSGQTDKERARESESKRERERARKSEREKERERERKRAREREREREKARGSERERARARARKSARERPVYLPFRGVIYVSFPGTKRECAGVVYDPADRHIRKPPHQWRSRLPGLTCFDLTLCLNHARRDRVFDWRKPFGDCLDWRASFGDCLD